MKRGQNAVTGGVMVSLLLIVILGAISFVSWWEGSGRSYALHDMAIVVPPISRNVVQAPVTPAEGPIDTDVEGATTTTPTVIQERNNALVAGAVLEDRTYAATSVNTSALVLDTVGPLTLRDVLIAKSGNSPLAYQNGIYSPNAALVVRGTNTISFIDSLVETDGAGAHGLFVDGWGARVALSNGGVKTSGYASHGIVTTNGGEVTLNSFSVSTAGANARSFTVLSGGGAITARDGTVTALGSGASALYASGTISIANSKVSSLYGPAAIIEGPHAITFTKTSVSSGSEGAGGVILFSGSSPNGQASFVMNGGSITHTATQGPLFSISNITGDIRLTGVGVTTSGGILVRSVAVPQWGTSGSNGGETFFTAEGTGLIGDMVADKASSITITLRNRSHLQGAVNADDTARRIHVSLDSTSKWTVTKGSYVTSIFNLDGISGETITNIIGNGYTVYYDKTDPTNVLLEGRTYALTGGGYLMPRQ